MLRTPAAPMRRGNLAEQVALDLSGQITGGTLPPGFKLPPEAELCATFGVSRTVVREAISRLKSDGLVYARQGSGVFVASEQNNRPFRIDSNQSNSVSEILQIVELRMAFEVEAAALAAQRRTQRDLDAMRRSLDQIAEAIVKHEDGVDPDVEFHRNIAVATGNPLYLSFSNFLDQFVRRSIRLSRQRTARRPGLGEKVQREHIDIYEAILRRDPVGAAAAARHHITNTAKRLKPRLVDASTT
jgi:GntR family transcriptional repressor for pyruvate dehydrogenase complex